MLCERCVNKCSDGVIRDLRAFIFNIQHHKRWSLFLTSCPALVLVTRQTLFQAAVVAINTGVLKKKITTH